MSPPLLRREALRRESPLRTRLLGAALLALCVGCVEERVVHNRPFLGALPGAETNQVVTPPRGLLRTQAPVGDEKIVVEAPDGSKRLLAGTVRHLMVHIHNTLKNDEEDLFVDQVLSEATRRECFARGVDPRETFRFLKANEEEIDRLFGLMPFGEFTPGVYLERVEAGTHRLRLYGPVTRDLTYVGLDAVQERGNFRLRWFVEE